MGSIGCLGCLRAIVSIARTVINAVALWIAVCSDDSHRNSKYMGFGVCPDPVEHKGAVCCIAAAGRKIVVCDGAEI